MSRWCWGSNSLVRQCSFSWWPQAEVFGIPVFLLWLQRFSTARSGSPPRLRSSRRWRGRRWPRAREHYAREAPDCPRPRPHRRIQSHPQGSRPGRGLELGLLQDPWREENNQGYRNRGDFSVFLYFWSWIILPEHVIQWEFRDVLLQDFNLCTNVNPSVHLSNPIRYVPQHQLLKAPAAHTEKD